MTLIAACAVVLCAVRSPALDSLVRPVLPSLGGQGRSSVAVAEGFETFFSNPAGFRSESGEVTVLSLSPWLESRLEWGQGLESTLLEQAAEDGVRFGGSIGIGYAGRGLGLGLLFTGGARIQGDPVLAGEVSLQLAVAGGYSYAFHLSGLDVAFGACVRPLLRAEIPLDDAAARDVIHASAAGGWPLFDALWSLDALYGVGVALDMGALVDIGPLRVGVLVTDVGDTQVSYSRIGFGELVERLVALRGIPEGSSADEGLTVPMQLRVGAAYEVSPALLLHAEICDPFVVMRGDADLLESLHAGLELSVGKRGRIWLGMEGTAASAGAAWRLGPLQTSVAIYGLDLRPQADTVMGLAAETAIRF